MVNKIKQYIEKHNMIIKGDTIILGISGGADSVCLFFVLLELKNMYDLELVAVHVNHNLRGDDARKDQDFVISLCEKYGVPYVIVDADVQMESGKRKKSIEETGREIRQEAFVKIAGEYKDAKIATAHHSNDNAETMIMNLVRGTGISGLTGIAPMVSNRIRPLLGVTRVEIEKYLEGIKESYCIDLTNYENIYIRNIIRNQVIPILEEGVNSQALTHMEETIEELRKIEEYLQVQVEMSWESVVEENEEVLLIKKDAILELPLILQERLIKKALEQVAGQQRDLTRKHINQLLDLFQKQVGRATHLPYGVQGKRIYQGVALEKQGDLDKRKNLVKEENIEECELLPGISEVFEECKVTVRIFEKKEWEKKCQEIKDAPYTKYFDYDIISGTIGIRKRQVGDYIVINSNGNTQTLKKYYITNKIPENQRKEIPLIVQGNEVLWIIGHRVSCRYGINEQTKRILEIQYDGGNYGRNN